MGKTLLILTVFVLAAARVSGREPVDYVNPLMGTMSKYEMSAGNTYPAVAMPWGMNFWTPQTGPNGDGWIYKYTADKIVGFKQTHQPSPWINDYGTFSIMPTSSGPYVFDQQMRSSWFSHKSEVATPYYYGVYLADHDITAEMAPTERSCFFRFTFPSGGDLYSGLNSVVIDAFEAAGTGRGNGSGSWIKVVPQERKVVGYTTRNSGGVPENFRNWFVIVFDAPISLYTLWDSGRLVEDAAATEIAGPHAGAVLQMGGGNGGVVHARVASSFISLEQAEINLRELDLPSGDNAPDGTSGRSALLPTRQGGISEPETGRQGESAGFDAVAERGRGRWNEVLGRVEFPNAGRENLDDLRTFYSCLYRSLLFPRDFSEIDEGGTRVHYSPYDGLVHEGEMWTDTGFWDTFRALFPLLNLLYPEINGRIQAGLSNVWHQSGFLPEWASPGHRDCMIGNNSASVVADAWLGGIGREKKNVNEDGGRYTDDGGRSLLNGWTPSTIWTAVTHGANASMPGVGSTGRLGWEYYNRLGYVPCDVGINESAARTLEYAYADWCIWQFGLALGCPAEEIAAYEKRSKNWRNVFDPSTGWMRGRREDGTFREPFNPLAWGGDFTEGNAMHYTWSVFHDPAGLAGAVGDSARQRQSYAEVNSAGSGSQSEITKTHSNSDKELFAQKLNSIFSTPPVFNDDYYGFPIHEIREMQVADMGNYAHGNQPIQHMIYLYNWSSEPHKAQYWAREVMRRMYRAAPDGYCGDEDNGQTSAWFVFSALGFYPVCPGSGEYALGSPLFKKVVLHLPGDKKLKIVARRNSPENVYVRSVRHGCGRIEGGTVSREKLLRGGRLVFKMSPVPDGGR